MQYIVTYNRGIITRNQLDTGTGLPIRKFNQGERFEGKDPTPQNDQIWVRVTNPDDAPEYACIQIGSHIVAQEDDDSTFPRVEWVKAIDNWTRIQGFKGPQP